MKTYIGKIVSSKMNNTVVVEVERTFAHPLYVKQLRRHSRLKSDTNGIAVQAGQTVKIGECRPISKQKHYKVLEVIEKIS